MTSTTLRHASALAIGLALAVAPTPAGAAETAPVATTVSVADRAAAVSYWTPGRRAQLSADDRLSPAETVAKLWNGTVPPGVGRLFLTMEPGGDESCTATVVPSSTKDVAFTAGHCVNGGLTRDDQPVKVTHVVFAPGYHDGKAPHGLFPVRAFAWSATYEGPYSSVDDDAVIALDPAGGKHVAEVAGAQAIAFGQLQSPVDTTILGYPASRLARGEALVSCRLASTFSSNSVSSSWNSGCDMAGGSSGGPWLRNFNPATGKGTLFSVTSKGTVNEDGVTENLSGAAFTDAVKSLYDHAGRL